MITFLVRIEAFYDRREKLEEIEILTESFIYHDPLNVINEGKGNLKFDSNREDS